MKKPTWRSAPLAQKKRGRMARSDRREQLFSVANRIVAAEGVKGLTMERLSAMARISKPVVYSHFRNRGELLMALLQNYWNQVDHQVPVEPKPGQSFKEHLRESIHGHLDVVLNGAGAVRHLLHTVIEDPAIEKLRLDREEKIIKRWTQKTVAHYGLPQSDAEHLAVVYRGALEAGASYVSRFPGKRRAVEQVCITMGLATLDALRQPAR